MNKIQIISDKNKKSQKIKSVLVNKIKNLDFVKSNMTIVMFDLTKSRLFILLINADFIFWDFLFLSEIILILFMLVDFRVVPSARLELALRKRQGF